MKRHLQQPRSRRKSAEKPFSRYTPPSRISQPHPLITVKEAAAELGITAPTVRDWTMRRQCPLNVIRFNSRVIRIRRTDLDSFMATHRGIYNARGLRRKMKKHGPAKL